jgi:tetratricopeptide (TPR) repeat protein
VVEGEAMLKEAIKLCGQAVNKFNNPDYRHKLALAHYQLAELYTRQERFAEAGTSLTKAEELWQKLVKEQPKLGAYRRFLALTFDGKGRLLFNQDQLAEARKSCEAGLTHWESLVKSQPQFEEFQDGKASCQEILAHIDREQKRLPAAEKLQREVLTTRQKLVDANPKNALERRSLAKSMLNLAAILMVSNKTTEAAGCVENAQKVAKSLPATDHHFHYLLAEVDAARSRLPVKPAPELAAATKDSNKKLEDQAMAALQQAVALGFTSATTLRQDHNFDAMRDREDFKQLQHKLDQMVASLNAAGAKNGPDTKP